MSLSRKAYKKMLDELCTEYCNRDYCILKEFLIESHPQPRTLLQMKCLEKFKYLINKDKVEEIGWGEAVMKWVADGYAEGFAKVYDDDKTFTEIWKELGVEK